MDRGAKSKQTVVELLRACILHCSVMTVIMFCEDFAEQVSSSLKHQSKSAI